jgi:2-polyprenyl-3-methyl-5-hydroxy-6-metoxy-1,4-benzoquinol methylase
VKSTTTKEPQYEALLDLKARRGIARLGLMNNQVWHDDPRRLVFTLARYKFVSKLLSGKESVLEVGCGDAFASRIVKQEVKSLTVIDFDPIFIADIEERSETQWPIKAAVHDMLQGPYPGKFDGIYTLDVLEHIQPDAENRFLRNVMASLDPAGALIVGMPSLESQAFASPQSKEGHVNCKSGKDLKRFLERYFSNVFLFSMNDEVVHTGFSPMAHYLLAVCASPLSAR